MVKVKNGIQVILYNGISGTVVEIDKVNFTIRTDTMYNNEFYHIQNIEYINGEYIDPDDLDFE